MESAKLFTATIFCAGCGSSGQMTWEKIGGNRSFVSLSSGFHERISKKAPYELELVCNNCGRHQVEGAP